MNSKPVGDSVGKHSSAAACDAKAVDLDLLVEPNLLRLAEARTDEHAALCAFQRLWIHACVLKSTFN